MHKKISMMDEMQSQIFILHNLVIQFLLFIFAGETQIGEQYYEIRR